MLSRQELIEIGHKARAGLVPFRRIFLESSDVGEYKPAPFHHQWSEYLLNSDKSFAIEAFRQSAKTNYVLRAFPLYSLAFPDEKRSYILIIKANATEAENKLKDVIDEYKSNPACRHNLVKIVIERGDCFEVIVKNEVNEEIKVRIEARGKGASIRGMSTKDKRPQIIIADDVQDLKDVKGETVWASDWKWFISDVCFLGKDARIFLIGNNLGEKCVLEQAITNAAELNFEVMRVAQIDDEGKPTWADRDKIEDILEEKEKYRKMGQLDEWLREKMCVSVSEENRIFSCADLRYYCEGQKKNFLPASNLFLLSDLASSRKTTSDYRVLMLIAVDSDDRWFVVECQYGRWQTTEYLSKMFDIVRRYKLINAYAEDGQILQTMDSVIKQQQRIEGCYFTVIPLKPSGRQKEYRIKALQPRFRSHMIWFLQDADYLKELESELLGFTNEGTKTLHDDLIDTLAYGLDVCVAPHRKSAQESYVELNAGTECLL